MRYSPNHASAGSAGASQNQTFRGHLACGSRQQPAHRAHRAAGQQCSQAQPWAISAQRSGEQFRRAERAPAHRFERGFHQLSFGVASAAPALQLSQLSAQGCNLPPVFGDNGVKLESVQHAGDQSHGRRRADGRRGLGGRGDHPTELGDEIVEQLAMRSANDSLDLGGRLPSSGGGNRPGGAREGVAQSTGGSKRAPLNCGPF